MGTWGSGTFEEDSGLDWLAELRASADAQRDLADEIRRAGDPALRHLDSGAPAGCRLRVAAELLAAAGGAPSPALAELEGVAAWVRSDAIVFEASLACAAREALDALVDPNRCALAMLWVRESFAPPEREWLEAVQDLSARLDRTIGRAPRELPSVSLTRHTIEAPEDLRARLDLLRELLTETGSPTAALHQLAAVDGVARKAIAEHHALAITRWLEAALGVPPDDATLIASWRAVGGAIDDEELDRRFESIVRRG